MRACLAFIFFCACSGPEAPDAALCRDFVHRLCLPEVCSTVQSTLSPGSSCEEQLLQNTGCGSDEFEFAVPTRGVIIECRLFLLHQGTNINQHSDCGDVDDMFDRCPDVVTFLKGSP